jgi:hypothetical protein
VTHEWHNLDQLRGGPELQALKSILRESGDPWAGDILANIVDFEGQLDDRRHNAYRAAAKKKYSCDGELEFDNNNVVSLIDNGGAYVMCWRWVPISDLPEDMQDDAEERQKGILDEAPKT